jgi:hypothetical protein
MVVSLSVILVLQGCAKSTEPPTSSTPPGTVVVPWVSIDSSGSGYVFGRLNAIGVRGGGPAIVSVTMPDDPVDRGSSYRIDVVVTTETTFAPGGRPNGVDGLDGVSGYYAFVEIEQAGRDLLARHVVLLDPALLLTP